MTNPFERHQSSKKELSKQAAEAINFILNYQPYRCYDAATRILAVLLRNGYSQDESKILTTPSSKHFWVRIGSVDYSTVDISNFRESPITNDECVRLSQEAETYALKKGNDEFLKWIFDKSGTLQKEQDKLTEQITNPRLH